MSGLKRLINEIHRRSLWQVLAIYLLGAAVGYQLIEALVSGLGLPAWFPALAIVLFIVGLPIVLATAFTQEGLSPAARQQDPTLLPEGGRPEDRGVQRLFTWRNAIFGGVLAFALWGVVATGWLFLGPGVDGRSAGASAEVRRSIAVLPFVNMEGDENASFTKGIHEDILTHLSKIRDLTVISRTSVMLYAGSDKPSRRIAEELGVGTLLKGSVRRAGGQVRVVTQLIDAETDAHLWAETYDRELTAENVFAIQTDVAQQIARALQA